MLVCDNDVLAIFAVLGLSLLPRDGLGVHFHVFGKTGNLDTIAVEVDFDSTKCTSHIVSPPLDERLEVLINAFHTELAVICSPCDLCVVVALEIGDLGFAHLAHVVCPCLLVLFLLL